MKTQVFSMSFVKDYSNVNTLFVEKVYTYIIETSFRVFYIIKLKNTLNYKWKLSLLKTKHTSYNKDGGPGAEPPEKIFACLDPPPSNSKKCREGRGI